MTEFDREVFGKELLAANIAMIRDFALAYRLRDEHYVYDDSKTIKDFKVVGHKRECLDKFIGDHILPGRIHISRRVVGRALSVARSRTRGRRNYFDSINSYLGMIKGTTDLRQARAILDAVNRKGFVKDYDKYKLCWAKD